MERKTPHANAGEMTLLGATPQLNQRFPSDISHRTVSIIFGGGPSGPT